MTSDSSLGPRQKWVALALLMFLAFLNYLDRSLLFPLTPLIKNELHLTGEQVGLLTTGFHIVYAFAAPLVGRLSDRFPRKILILVILLSWSGITAMSGTASGFTALLVWRSFTGLGEGGYFPAALSLIGDYFGPKERGLAIALHGVTTTLGGSAGYALGGVLGTRFGWRMPFFLALAPGIALAVCIFVFLREPPRTQVTKESEEATRSWIRIVSSAPVLLISLAAASGSFAMNGLNPFIPDYLSQHRGLSVAQAGIVSGALYAATLVGQLAGGIVSDRFAASHSGGRPMLVAIAYGIAAPALACIVHAPGLGLALLGYGLTQAARGFAEPNLYATILDSVSPRERGAAQGFLLLCTFAGAALGSWAAGRLRDRGGYELAFNCLSAGTLLVVVFAGILVATMRKKDLL